MSSPRHDAVHDVSILDEIVPKTRSPLHRFERLFVQTLLRIFRRADERERLAPTPLFNQQRTSGLRSDHTVDLTGNAWPGHDPDPLRRVTSDAEPAWFLTNSIVLRAAEYRWQISKCRWQVDVRQMLKQHRRMKSFYGTTKRSEDSNLDRRFEDNCTRGHDPEASPLEASLYQVCRFSVLLFSRKCPFYPWKHRAPKTIWSDPNQLILFEF